PSTTLFRSFAGRNRRLSLRAGREWEYRDRRSGLHVRGNGREDGNRSGNTFRRPRIPAGRDRRRTPLRFRPACGAAAGFHPCNHRPDRSNRMTLIGTRMIREDKTARQIFEEVMANPARAKFGFGRKLAIVNVDVQNAYTRIDEFKTAYETDPRQIEYINTLSDLARSRN